MDLNLRFPERGFTRADFVDRYQRRCSIQESSIATERCIWLGCEHETWGCRRKAVRGADASHARDGLRADPIVAAVRRDRSAQPRLDG